MNHQTRLAALAAATVLLCPRPAGAAVTVIIQPDASGTNAVWTVSWDSLAGDIATPGGIFSDNFDWDSMNPLTGAVSMNDPWSPTVGQAAWLSVGDPFTSLYALGNSAGFGHGEDGVTTSPADWGVGPDNFGTTDRFFLFDLTSTSGISSTGSFVLTVPLPTAGFAAAYNVGIHNDNPDVTITVTGPIPEPGRAALLLVGAFTLLLRRRRSS